MLEILLVASWVIPTWLAAYTLRVTAPVSCPDGRPGGYCKAYHLTHVRRLNAGYDLLLGLAWPILIGAVLVKGTIKSVEVAAEATPVERLRPRKIDTSRMLEAADREFEEIKKETDAHAIEIHEGKIVDP